MTEEKPIETCPGGLHCASRQIFAKIVYEKEINDLKEKLKRAEEVITKKDFCLSEISYNSKQHADDSISSKWLSTMCDEALAIKIGDGK